MMSSVVRVAVVTVLAATLTRAVSSLSSGLPHQNPEINFEIQKFNRDLSTDGNHSGGTSNEGGEFISSSSEIITESQGELVTIPESFMQRNDLLSLFAPLYSRTRNEKCSRHSKLVLEELQKFTLWATKMFDSSTKFPHGILHGSTYDLGNYDECLQVDVSLGAEQLRGKYCLVSVTVQPGNSEDAGFSESGANMSTWRWIQNLSRDPSRRARNEIHLALCVPDACSTQDIESHLESVFSQYQARYGVHVQVFVREKMCQTRVDLVLSWPDVAVICVFAFFVTTVVVCTLYDLFTSMSEFERFRLAGYKHQILESFSASANVVKLLTYTPSEDCLDCIHGLKFISICLIIMGHRIMFVLGSPIVNTQFVEGFYSKVEAMILLNGPIVVDTFFNISGFLVSYLLLLEYQKTKAVNFVMLYIHRYIRLTPVYLAVLAFYCTLFVKLGSGPLWVEKVGTEAERCALSWWANALYINNYVNVNNLCMIQSWFISCDMHLFLVSPFIVHLLYHKPRLGCSLLAGLTLASIAVTFSIIYFKQLDALLLLYMKTLTDPIANQTFRDMYIPTHARASPYLIGMAAGFIRYKMKNSSFRMPKVYVWLGWAMAILFVEGTVFSAWYFYLPETTYDALSSATYGSLHRITWSLGTSWMIVAMSTGNGAFIEPLFSWKPVITLSRLCYCAFLSHGGLQLYSVASIRTPYYGSLYNLVWYSLGDITLAFFVALALTLLFESPILGLERILRKNGNCKNECVSTGGEYVARNTLGSSSEPQTQNKRGDSLTSKKFTSVKL